MRNIVQGDITPVLKSLIELGGWSDGPSDPCGLFGLLSAGHLTFLLAQSGAGAGLTGGIGGSSAVLSELMSLGLGSTSSVELPNESSLVEELFLEVAQRLNQLDYPLEVRRSLTTTLSPHTV
jgi:hypothetical protein